MREELRKKLTDNRARFVSELDVSTSFLASLLSAGVIKEEHKAAIQVSDWYHGFLSWLFERYRQCIWSIERLIFSMI